MPEIPTLVTQSGGSRPGLILWAGLIVVSIVLMSIGLWRAMFFGFMQILHLLRI